MPKGALFHLHCLTRGEEEQVFHIENGVQVFVRRQLMLPLKKWKHGAMAQLPKQMHKNPISLISYDKKHSPIRPPDAEHTGQYELMGASFF